MTDAASTVTYLFSDVEGSTRLWESEPERIGPALARHDTLARDRVAAHGGRIVKMTGDGVHAVFADPVQAVQCALALQLALSEPPAGVLPLAVRFGLHLGADERRDGDYFGQAVNRAARVMQAAHGGQVLLSHAVAERVRDRLPDGCGLRELGLVRLRDLATPERLYQMLHAGLRADFPPLRSLASTPNNLPQQLNSFIGRSRELDEVRTMLSMPTVRLLTLLGMGGLGKSRLSLQAAAEVLDDYPDGVWFVELAPITDPQSVPQALASVLGVKEEAGGDVQDALLRYLRDKAPLVVLDNCEHVVQACAELARRLLQFAPGVKILASSRDALQTAGETVIHVPPLAAPDAGATISPATLAQIDAVRLFIDRATAVQPAFRVTDKNAAAVAAICRRLDGIPLALELAAARTRALSVEAIAARLDDRFKLLVTGERTVLPRQRTLRALIDWSYDLLNPPERSLFARLSVFAGGWTLEAAEAVGAGGEIDAADVLDLLASLVEKSLVMADVEGGRYRMLDTVRQYALEKLDPAGDGAQARSAHFGFFLALVEQAAPRLTADDQGEWLGRLDQERENVLAANDWADGVPERVREQVRLVRALRMYWFARGQLARGLALYTGLLGRPGLQARDGDRCRLLFGAGQLSFVMGRYTEARQFLSEALEIATETGDERAAAVTLQPLGMAYLGEGDHATARQCLEEALARATRLDNRREMATAWANLGMLHRIESDLPGALPCYRAALALARELGDHEQIARTLLNLAMVSVGLGDREAARSMTAEAADIGARIGSPFIAQNALEVCAGLASEAANWRLAQRFYAAAEAMRVELGLTRDPADEAFVQPRIARAWAAAPEARASGDDLPPATLEEARAWLAAGAR